MSEEEAAPTKVTRRSFLRTVLYGAGAGAGVLASGPIGRATRSMLEGASDIVNTGVDWKNDLYLDIDFPNNPELLIENPKAFDRITKDLTALSETVNLFLQRMAIKYNDSKISMDPEGYLYNALLLLNETIKQAELLVQVKELNLSGVEPEIKKKIPGICDILTYNSCPI